MGVFLGIDVGTVSLKAALVEHGGTSDVLSKIADDEGLFYRPEDESGVVMGGTARALVSRYVRIKGSPIMDNGSLPASRDLGP